MDKDKDDREKPAKRVVRKEVAIVLPEVKAPRFLQGFVDFIRELLV
jgi:hypothetical protein